jgi:hypothetical protein
MAVLMVTYDLKQPGRDYTPVHTYLKQFTYCKDLESFWLIDTQQSPQSIRDALKQRVDANDKVFVARLMKEWGGFNFGCGGWLNDSGRTW